MADNKKYYYMRLKESFFDDDRMKILESMPDGYLYSNILLKLYCKSLKHEGRLRVSEHVPYDADMISAVTGHQVGVVKQALVLFQKLELIEVIDNGTIYMCDLVEYIGDSTTAADRKRRQRKQIEAEIATVQTNVQKIPDKCPESADKCLESPDKSTPEIKIETETELETEIKIETETELETETETETERKGESEGGKGKRRRFHPPSLEEVQDYCAQNGYVVDAEVFVDYYESNGWKIGKNAMKSWQATLRNWNRRELKDIRGKPPEPIAGGYFELLTEEERNEQSGNG